MVLYLILSSLFFILDLIVFACCQVNHIEINSALSPSVKGVLGKAKKTRLTSV